MTQPQWSLVDEYFGTLFAPADAQLENALKATAEADMPAIQVSANQGKLLYLLARLCNAQSILEVGTLGGYSTIWLARALPVDGKLITLEISPEHAAVATRNIAQANLASLVTIRVGPATDSLKDLISQNAGPFDFIFIDADKANTPSYIESALRLARPGSLIVVDNVVRNGAVVEAESTDPNVQGIRASLAILASNPRLESVAWQVVGSKGYDGLAMALVLE
jgi:predicted O-methyltransferase YrrM